MVQEMLEAQMAYRRTRSDILRKRMLSTEAEVDAFLKRHLREGERGTFKGKVKDMKDTQKLFLSPCRSDAVKKLLGMAERDVRKELETYLASVKQPKLF